MKDRDCLPPWPSTLDSQDEVEDSSTPNGQSDDIPALAPQRKTQRASDPGTGAEGAALNGSVSSSGGADTATTAAFHHGQELGLEGLACVVKLYDFRDEQVKLNDTADFVGVLGYDQQLPPAEDVPTEGEAGSVSSNPFHGLESFARRVPPPSLAPRLHCICERLFGVIRSRWVDYVQALCE